MVTSLLYFRRYLTLALLLLTFVSGAWGDDFIYYRISDTSSGWKDVKLEYNGTSTGTVKIPLETGVYEFYFKQPEKTFYFTSPIEVEDGNEYLLTVSEQNNGKLTVATAGDYIFTVRWDYDKPRWISLKTQTQTSHSILLSQMRMWVIQSVPCLLPMALRRRNTLPSSLLLVVSATSQHSIKTL